MRILNTLPVRAKLFKHFCPYRAYMVESFPQGVALG